MLMIRNSKPVYPASGFVHVILELSLWGSTKEREVCEGKENLTTSNKSIKRSRCAKVEVLPDLLHQVRVKETVLNGLLLAGAQQKRLINL